MSRSPRSRDRAAQEGPIVQGPAFRPVSGGHPQYWPRPVGFKFHAVMVINSPHVLGQSAAVTERLAPPARGPSIICSQGAGHQGS